MLSDYRMCNCGKKRQLDGSRGEEAPAARRSVIVPPSRTVRHIRAPPAVPPPIRRAAPVVAAPVVAAPVRVGTAPPVRVTAPVRAATRQAPVVVAAPPRIYDTSIWGPPLWRILHKVAEVAETDTEWPSLLVALRACLPCPDCSRHYNAWVDEHAVDSGIDGGAKAWLLALHNDVNRRKGVSQWTPDMVSASVAAVRKRELDALLRRIRGKVGDAACQILTRMIGRMRE